MWYISFTALAISLLLSLRQRVYITDFAPYVMISTIAMVDIFMHSLRVRLPEFQKRYLRAFYVVIAVLGLSSAAIIFHQPLYYISSDKTRHFASRIYGPYELAKKLKEKGVECYDAKGRTALQLRYYGIPSCHKSFNAE
jgi:small basic protein